MIKERNPIDSYLHLKVESSNTGIAPGQRFAKLCSGLKQNAILFCDTVPLMLALMPKWRAYRSNTVISKQDLDSEDDNLKNRFFERLFEMCA